MIGALIAKKKIRSGFASIMRGDLDTFLSVFREDAVVIYPTKGTVQGKEAIRAFYHHFLEAFPKVEVDIQHICVENLFDCVGTNVVTVQWEIATTNRRGATFKQTGAQLIATKNGKIKYVHYFFFDTDHLRHAWRESE
jgi:uncharacterized protein (TIGR02246 family)